jgi:hypothetical protein
MAETVDILRLQPCIAAAPNEAQSLQGWSRAC